MSGMRLSAYLILLGPCISILGTDRCKPTTIYEMYTRATPVLSCCFFRASTASLDTVQDFLIKFGIKPRLHILKISIFSLNRVIVRPTKTMNNLLKVCKVCTFKVIFRHQKSTESFYFFFCNN